MKKLSLLITLLLIASVASFSQIISATGAYRPVITSAPAGSFSPRDSAGLLRWYEADTLSASDGTQIATWFNRSSPGTNNATSSGTGRPTFRTNVQNGKPALQFDGTDDFFTMNAISAAGPHTVFIVYKKTAGQKFPSLVSSCASNPPYVWFEWSDGFAYLNSYNCGAGFSASGNYTSFVTIAETITSCGTITVRANGANKSLTSIGSTGNTGCNYDQIGFRSADLANGYLYAIIVYDHAATTQLLTDVENYFRTKLNHY